MPSWSPHHDLASFVTSLAPSDAPESWLAANQVDILASVDEFLTSADNGETEFVQSLICEARIYHRFMVSTYMNCRGDIRIQEELKEMLASWSVQDDISLLALHRSIGEQLWTMQGYPTKLCDDDGYLNNLLSLDVIAVCAQLAVIIRDRERYQLLISKQGEMAQSLLDLFQTLLDYPHVNPSLKSPILKALIKLSRESGLYPKCPVLRGVKLADDYAVAAGAFGEVWKGIIEDQVVAIKMLKIYQSSDARKLLQDFSREVAIWRQLSNPNVLPFYGVYHWKGNFSRVCFISPWMENGNVKQYLESVPDADRIALALDIAQGLEYLHTMKPNIIHGDLKGVNILITPSYRACLSDFGLAAAADSQGLPSRSVAGTLRWQAPELFDPALNIESQGRNTLASDVYSYGCVIYEVFSDNYPLYEIKEPAIILAVLKGQRPARPSAEICLSRGLDDEIWNLMEDCWKMKPAERIPIGEVTRRLRSRPTRIDMDQRPTYDWDDSFPSKLRSTLMEHPFSRGQAVPKKFVTSSPCDPAFLSPNAGALDVSHPEIPWTDLDHGTSTNDPGSPVQSNKSSSDHLAVTDAPHPEADTVLISVKSLRNTELQRHNLLDAPTYGSSNDGSDIGDAPPSPTLSGTSSVHFVTSLALRNNKPEDRTGIPSLGRLPARPSGGRNYYRNASWTSFEEGPSSAGTEPEYETIPLARRRHAGSDATDGTHINPHSNSQLPKEKYSDTAVATPISEKGRERCNHGPAFPEFKLMRPKMNVAPFAFDPDELAHMVESKNLKALEHVGGIDGLLKGLGTNPKRGLSK